MLWRSTAYCVKLSGDDLSCCSNEIESDGLRKLSIFYQENYATITNISQSLPHIIAGKYLA